MPTNVTVEYVLAEEVYFKAKTPTERIAAMKHMIAVAPKHKSAEKLNAQLKRKLAELKKDFEREKKAGKGKRIEVIRKEGALTIVFLGVANSPKSRLFSKLAGLEYKSENEYGFMMRMIPYENVWMQGIDLPAFYAGISEAGGQIFDLVRTANFVVFAIKSADDFELIRSELAKRGIDINQKNLVSVTEISDIDDFKKKIWKRVGKIRVKTKTRGITAPKPVVLDAGANVKALAGTVHKDFVQRFKIAKVWGPSAKFTGQQVGLYHKLADGDIVEIFTK
ncbi:MAG: TGS domain-containing protein [DPANN group archaeon]|nr:TGS domain-containing protein [DPANN group archaeon]